MDQNIKTKTSISNRQDKCSALLSLTTASSVKSLFKSFKKITDYYRIPHEYTTTHSFKENIFVFFRERSRINKKVIPLFYWFLALSWIRTLMLYLSKKFAMFGRISVLYRIPCLLAFDQHRQMVKDEEFYLPRERSEKFQKELVDLTQDQYKERFFYDYGLQKRDLKNEVVEKAVAGAIPEYICIGSGIGVASALKGILEVNSRATAWILDRGDYYTQQEYFDMTPVHAVMNTYHGASLSPIMNSLTNVGVSLMAKVWGGGAEIFSGTAHRNDPWYIHQMGFTEGEYEDYFELFKKECDIGTQKHQLVSEDQIRFWKGAEKCGHMPYLLTKFGYEVTEGRGRGYAGLKDRIPYMDQFMSQNKNFRGIANCRVDKLIINKGRIEGIEVSFLGRCDREVLATKVIPVPTGTKVLLGAGSVGNYTILKNSGLKGLKGTGILHQYTTDILGLFEDELPANGNPQGIGIEIQPDQFNDNGQIENRRIVIEGGRPPRAVLNTIVSGPIDDIMLMHNKLKHVGSIGVMITEEKPGEHFSAFGNTYTRQPYTSKDHVNFVLGIEKAFAFWTYAGAKALSINLPVLFRSKNKELAKIGFFETSEIPEVIRHLWKYPPQYQAYYRTGNLFGLIDLKTGEHPEVEKMFVVSEDISPPGPGVNPSLGMMIQARRYGRNIARAERNN